VADRSHLSIGEVLSLLQGEFPDLTITKIRFLESQGLIDPERTPSGYRKFYEPDIERLRWILHQQRENFLPLKVIKDRLDESGDELPPLDDVVAAASRPAQLPLGESAGSEPAEASEPDRAAPVWMADHARVAEAKTPDEPAAASSSNGPTGPTGAKPPAPATAATAVAGDAPTPPPAATPPAPAAAGNQGKGSPKPAAAAPSKTEAASSAAASSKPPGAPAKAPAPKTAPASAARPGAAPDPRVDFPRAAVEGPRPADRPATPVPASPPVPVGSQQRPNLGGGSGPLDAGPSGVSFTFDELLAATGLTAGQARELEQYGLIEAGEVAGDPIYGDDAVVVARKAAVFFRHGAEPRHLRMFKVAADREAGFFEQIILPLLKQRNPAAKQQAIENLNELAQLGEALHAAFLRAALREHLGG
jgi:DNA-binding transcriptional MerR regulator